MVEYIERGELVANLRRFAPEGYTKAAELIVEKQPAADVVPVRRGARMGQYVNVDHLIDYLKGVRANRRLNDSPYMDNALINVQQLLEIDRYNPVLFDYFVIGDCEGCIWKGKRHQKCSCCRRNRYLGDRYADK